MVAEEAGDGLTVTHEEVVTGMTIDRATELEVSRQTPGTKDPLEEDEDDLTKAQTYLSPAVAGRTPNKDDKRCFYCQEIGHFVDRCYKKARDRRAAAEKAELQLLLDPTNRQDALPIPDPATDPGYDNSENEYPNQLNI